MLISSVQLPPPPAGNASVASVSTDVIPSGYTAIYSAEDLNNVRNKLDGKYILMNDIDLSSIDNWEPIGDSSSTPFTGTFDGNGHVIKNLKFKNSTAAQTTYALFRNIDKATIKNLGVENIEATGNIIVSGIVVQSKAGSNITNCYVSGNIYGEVVSGLTYANLGNISNCYVSANIYGDQVVGLIGINRGNVTNCYVSGNVSGKDVAAGIVGSNGKSISNCYFSGNLSGDNEKFLICKRALNNQNSFTNVWADKKNSTLSAFGEIETGVTITNSGAVSHEEFTSHEFWDKQNFDSDVWEMSYSIPPVLKGIGGQEINWYFQRGNNDFRLQVGSGSDPAANAMFVNTGLDLGAMNIDLSTVEGCLDASRCVKAALDAVTKRTADIGIEQSRLETISNVNTTQIENLSAAYSTVTEADVAEEVANYTKAQIMAQAASSLITQTQNFQANLLLRMISSLG